VFKSYGNDGQWDHDLPTESDSWGATWSMKRGFRRDVMWQNLKKYSLAKQRTCEFSCYQRCHCHHLCFHLVGSPFSTDKSLGLVHCTVLKVKEQSTTKIGKIERPGIGLPTRVWRGDVAEGLCGGRSQNSRWRTYVGELYTAKSKAPKGGDDIQCE